MYILLTPKSCAEHPGEENSFFYSGKVLIKKDPLKHMKGIIDVESKYGVKCIKVVRTALGMSLQHWHTGAWQFLLLITSAYLNQNSPRLPSPSLIICKALPRYSKFLQPPSFCSWDSLCYKLYTPKFTLGWISLVSGFTCKITPSLVVTTIPWLHCCICFSVLTTVNFCLCLS